MLIGGLLAPQTDESIARVGYGLVEQSRYVIDSSASDSLTRLRSSFAITC